jgi:glutamyl-tRNA reductase
MHNNFKVVSLTYKNTPLNIRELVSFDETACKRLLMYFKEFTTISEAIVISTCNRTEVYYSSEVDMTAEIIKLIGLERNFPDIARYSEYFVKIDNPESAVRHLFKVAMGVEAQVIGDMQISNQVKNAYQWSADENMSGPFIHRLMHTIFFTNKRVVQETSFRDGAASVSYAAVQLIEELASDFLKPKILVLGLGEIGEDVCKNLADYSKAEIFVCNRTFEKASKIAEECGFQVLPYEGFEEILPKMDVVVCSVMADKPIISKALISEIKILSHKIFLDLSVPRSIENTIEELPGVLLYNIDSIHSKTNEALENRIAAIPQVLDIVEEAILDFNDWAKEMEVSPTIKKLKNALENIRQEEVARFLKSANTNEAELIEKVTKSMMQKIIKLPVLQLKAACKRGEAETLIDVLNNLFDLEKENQTEDLF